MIHLLNVDVQCNNVTKHISSKIVSATTQQFNINKYLWSLYIHINKYNKENLKNTNNKGTLIDFNFKCPKTAPRRPNR